MALHLDQLLINSAPDVVTDDARFYTYVPKLAPYAYLHTIFNPASSVILKSVATQVEIPEAWALFLQTQNGAFLFSNALRLDGVVDPHRLHSRQSNYAQNAFSLIKTNRDPVMNLFPGWLRIGDYGFDGSKILMNKRNQQIQAIESKGLNILATWPDLETFLTSEIERIGMLYSPSGQCLVDRKFTAPNSEAPG
jgi:hypothetical protein